MSMLDKYGVSDINKVSYSPEGFTGGLLGFIMGGSWVGASVIGIGGNLHIQKIRQDINTISERIAKLRNGQIKEAKEKGTHLPARLKEVDTADVIGGAIAGVFFGPFYGAYKGSQIQNENERLEVKLKELETELKRAGIDSTD